MMLHQRIFFAVDILLFNPAGAEDVINNNRMRRELEGALAALRLFSRDRAERAPAIDELKDRADEGKLALIEKAEAAIDWATPAALIERRVRAFDPFPGCHFVLDGQPVKLWRARVLADAGRDPQTRNHDRLTDGLEKGDSSGP